MAIQRFTGPFLDLRAPDRCSLCRFYILVNSIFQSHIIKKKEIYIILDEHGIQAPEWRFNNDKIWVWIELIRCRYYLSREPDSIWRGNSVLEMKNWIYWSESNSWIYFYIVLNKNWKHYWFEQNFTGLGLQDRCSSWGLRYWLKVHGTGIYI